MENKRFDELAKSVASMASRRRVLRGVLGSAVAGVAGAIGLRGVDAAQVRRGLNQICRKDGDCQEGMTCEFGRTGRGKCCVAGSNICNNSCCQTFCDPKSGCTDGFVSPSCYHDCLNTYCYSTNFNYTFNNGSSCEEFCAYNICRGDY